MEHVSKAQIKMVRSLQQKKFRDELGLFVAEGDKCIDELCKGFELVHLFCEGENATSTEIEQMSGLRAPQGSIAVFRSQMSDVRSQMSDLVVVLDGIQDPGNLGTIIRTCDWFGVKQIVCSPNTADCFNPKVVQATMGALARVNVTYTDLPAFLADKPVVFGTLLEGRNMYDVLKAQPLTAHRSPLTVIFGNEGNGISPEVRKYITHPLRIPCYPEGAETSESLNVAIATAIVLAEFRRPSN